MLIEIGIAESIGGIVGFGACALLTGGRIADEIIACMNAEEEAGNQKAIAKLNAEACRINQSKLSAIRDLLDKPRTIRKGELASILDGDA